MSGGRGLPLHKAVVRFQQPGAKEDQGTTSAATVQHMCDRITIDAPFRFVLQISDDDCFFDVVVDGDVGDGPDSNDTRGVFCIGDESPSMYDGTDGGAFGKHVEAHMRTLHEVLNGSLRHEWNTSAWSISAQVGDDLQSLPIAISADAFRAFHVIDWCGGTMAEKSERTFLRAVHILCGTTEAPANASAAQTLGGIIQNATMVAGARRRGRPDKYDWPALEREAFRIMGELGVPQESNPKLKFQSELVEQLQQFYIDWKDEEPQPSQINEKLALWIVRFKAGERP